MTRTPAPDTTDRARENLVAYYTTFRKHWVLVVSVALLSTGAALLFSRTLPPIYEASVMLEINPHAVKPLGDKTTDVLALGMVGPWETREYYETQYKILASEKVIGAVVRSEGLAHDKDFLERHGLTKRPPTEHDIIDALRKSVTVDPVKQSSLVNVHVEDTDPKRAKRLCDAIANAYIDQNLQTAIGSSSEAVEWLNTQLDHVKGELESDENALHVFKERNQLPSTSINEASNMLRMEMQGYTEALTKTRTQAAEIAARVKALQAVQDDPDVMPSTELLKDAFLAKAREEYVSALKAKSELLGEGKGESHPLVRSANEKLQVARDAMLGQIKSIRGALEHDLEAVKSEEASESGLLESSRKLAVDLSMKEIEYHRLDRAREQNEKLYGMLLEHLKEADLARMMRTNNIRVIDAATEPRLPVKPRIVVNTVLGGLIGVVIGFVFAWLREQLDTSIKTPDDVESFLGASFLGLLPELGDDTGTRYGRKGRRKSKKQRTPEKDGPVELSVHAYPLSGVAESARAIRTNIMFMNPDRPYRKLIVTSAAPAEGKTTVACSIAIALAQGGQRVCIVDADLRRPRLHRIFDRAGDVGVTNYLLGESTLDEIAKPTVVENLWSIPAGPIPPNPGDILHSERFRQFVEELGERFDRVIIDTPPIVAVTDSAIISRLVDGIVFVARALHTSKHLSLQGLRSLRDVDAPVLGVVLNAVNLTQRQYSYYYAYYYSYKREGYRSASAGEDARVDDASAGPPN
jgi:capsular exopolysaccharide synthesis family protein